MRVTIGIPFFNAEQTLAKAVQSVFAQSLTDWELLLVDDGSSDASLDIARSVRDGRVTVLSDGQNRGLPHRLNEIAEAAGAPYVARMDADDLMHPHRLARQLDYLEQNPDVDVLGTSAISIDAYDFPQGVRPAGTPTSQREALQRGVFIHPSVMARRAWMRANPYSSDFPRAEDRELWCRAFPRSRFATLSEPLLFYREPDRVRLHAYIQSCRTDRAIIRTYGPAAAGRTRAMMLVLGSYLKEFTYRVASATRQSHHLVRRRSRPLPADLYAAAASTLTVLLETPVPGLRSTSDVTAPTPGRVARVAH